MTRTRANLWWAILAAALALECVGYVRAGYPLGSTGSGVGIRSHEFDTARGKVGYTLGCRFGRWLPSGGAPLEFLVIEGPVDPAFGHFRGGARVIFDAARSSRMWLPVTRTNLINVNTAPRQVFGVSGDQVTVSPLPDALSLGEFEVFLKTPEARDGAEGWRRWLDRRRK